MFKFYLSATLVIILSTLTSTVLAQSDVTNQSVQASNSTLVVRQIPHIFTTVTAAKSTALVADSSSNNQDVVEKLGGARVLLAMAAVGGTVGVILSARKANLFKSSTIPHFNTTEDLISINQANRKLQKQLLRLLHDDQATANRLLSQVKIKNPNRSIDWCVEKVIYDLERDRGRY